MLGFIVRRSLQAVVVLLVIAALVFVGVYVVGNPTDILVNPQANLQERTQVITALGLDQPLWVQCVRFVTGALHGDLGRSFVHDTPALGFVLERLPATLELAGVALLIALVVGAPLGVWAGLKPKTAAGRVITAGSTLGVSLPTFWAGVLLVMVFAVLLGWLPAGGRGPTSLFAGIAVSFLSVEGWRHLILPATSLALFTLALLVRLTRDGARAAARQDYVKFAHAKGLTNARVIGAHILRNLVMSIGALIGPAFGSLIAFAVVTETVFAWPGIGKLLVDSIKQVDRPTLVAYLLVTIVVLIVINLVADILYYALDPRMRAGTARG